MASFQQRGKTWQYTVSRMVNGKSDPIREGGYRTKSEAKVAALIVEAELKKGIKPIPHKQQLIAFSDYFLDWVKVYKKHLTGITLDSYNTTHTKIEEYFKDKPIQDIPKRAYQAFLNDYALTHAKTSTKKLNGHIRACVKEAIDEELIKVDFTRGAVIDGKNAVQKDSEKHMHYNDSQRWLMSIESKVDEGLEFLMLLLGFVSGMRYAELAGLTEDDFNFSKNTIKVHRSWQYKKEIGFGPLKNDQSEREIKIDKITMLVFKRFFKKRTSYITNVHKLVFFDPNSSTTVVTNDRLNDVLSQTLEELSIQRITVHGLRHTHASILILEDVSIYYISERLGHGDIETTMKYYAHLLNEMREKEIKATVSAFEKIRSIKVV